MSAEWQDSRAGRQRSGPGGYTMIEMLVVIGIILLMITLVLISVNAILRSTRMARATSLLVSAVDEARTAAITLRRTTRIDRTVIDLEEGINRLTVFGPGYNENFEGYQLPDAENPEKQDPDLVAGWKISPSRKPRLVVDGSRVLRMEGSGGAVAYWNTGMRVDSLKAGEYEAILQARIKILHANRTGPRKLVLLGSIKEGGNSISQCYRMALSIVPATGGRNAGSTVTLEKGNGTSGATISGGKGDGDPMVETDASGGADGSATCRLIEGIWYRVQLSVKRYERNGKEPVAEVSGKVWVDGQLEPPEPTVGPVTDTSPLDNGYGGFGLESCDALVDDILFDLRPVRALPTGLLIDAMDPSKEEATMLKPDEKNPADFPILFRPDGTSESTTILRITDLTTGDRRYVRIDPNTGRTRIGNEWKEVRE